jgi:hypothetical protein
MKHELEGKDLQTLLTLHSQEIDWLNEKLLSGELWENLQTHRRNITELAIAIQRLHNYSVAKNMKIGNPAEFPQSDHISAEPVE